MFNQYEPNNGMNEWSVRIGRTSRGKLSKTGVVCIGLEKKRNLERKSGPVINLLRRRNRKWKQKNNHIFFSLWKNESFLPFSTLPIPKEWPGSFVLEIRTFLTQKSNEQIWEAFVFEISPESQRWQSCFDWEKEVLFGLDGDRGERISQASLWSEWCLGLSSWTTRSCFTLPQTPGMAEPWMGRTVCSGR